MGLGSLPCLVPLAPAVAVNNSLPCSASKVVVRRGERRGAHCGRGAGAGVIVPLLAGVRPPSWRVGLPQTLSGWPAS